MIVGLLSELHQYRAIHPNLAKAIDCILGMDIQSLQVGRQDLESDNLFYMVNQYCTKDAAECEPEKHRQFADIQIMIEGSERFGHTSFTGQIPSTDFKQDNDVAFYKI